MKMLSVRVSDRMAAELTAESRAQGLEVRYRARKPPQPQTPNVEVPQSYLDIAHLIGSVDGLPADLSSNIKQYLRAGYGRKKRSR